MKANDNITLTEKEKKKMIKKLEKQFKKILEIMEFDVNTDQQITGTPHRIAKMYVNELFSGCYTEQPKMTVFDNDQSIHNMVFLGPITIKSTCSHHFIPFLGECYVGYIPNKKIVGISKLARIVKWFMRRPQIQEELCEQIINFIEEELNPLGCGVYVKAQHLCMIARGVEETNSFMESTSLRGCFKNLDTKNEFILSIRK